MLGMYLIHCFRLLHNAPWCHGVFFLSSLPVMGFYIHCLQLLPPLRITAVNILVHVPLWNWVCESCFEFYTQKWDLPQG